MTSEAKAEFYSLTREQREKRARTIAAAITKHYRTDTRTRDDLLAEIAQLEAQNTKLWQANARWKQNYQLQKVAAEVSLSGWRTANGMLKTQRTLDGVSSMTASATRASDTGTQSTPEKPPKRSAWQSIKHALLG